LIGLKLRKDKIKLLNEGEYNGFMISKDGVKPAKSKVEAIHGAKAPENIGELRSFIGLANYLREFVKGFSENQLEEEFEISDVLREVLQHCTRIEIH
jgi:hypothetical protein